MSQYGASDQAEKREANATRDGQRISAERKSKETERTERSLARVFKEEFGIEVEILPHDAGTVHYGRHGKITIVLNPPKVEEVPAVLSTPDRYPFRGYFEKVGGTTKVRIQNGDVNSVVPPEVQGGSGSVDYDTADYIYYISAEFDSSGFTGVVAVGRGSSVPANTSTVAYRRLFQVAGGVIMPSVRNSLEVAQCGGSTYSWGSV